MTLCVAKCRSGGRPLFPGFSGNPCLRCRKRGYFQPVRYPPVRYRTDPMSAKSCFENARRNRATRRRAARLFLAVAVVGGLAGSVSVVAQQQPCNPIVDGTYCAEQMPRNRTSSQSGSSGGGYATPMRSIGTDLSLGADNVGSPATIGAITFRGGGEKCVGLLFRGRCS